MKGAWMHSMILKRPACVAIFAVVFSSSVLANPRGVDDLTATNQSVVIDPETRESGHQRVESVAGREPPEDTRSEDKPVAKSSASAKRASTLISRDGESASSGRRSAASGSWYSQGFVPLFIVLGLLGGGYYLARRFMPTESIVEGNLLRVVARTTLSPKHTIALVQLGHRFVMVGMSPDHVEALCSITDDDEIADLTRRLGGRPSNGGLAFDQLLLKESRGFESPLEEDESAATSSTKTVSGATRQLEGLLGRLKSLQSRAS